jgi:hypothetical protein
MHVFFVAYLIFIGSMHSTGTEVVKVVQEIAHSTPNPNAQTVNATTQSDPLPVPEDTKQPYNPLNLIIIIFCSIFVFPLLVYGIWMRIPRANDESIYTKEETNRLLDERVKPEDIKIKTVP